MEKILSLFPPFCGKIGWILFVILCPMGIYLGRNENPICGIKVDHLWTFFFVMMLFACALITFSKTRTAWLTKTVRLEMLATALFLSTCLLFVLLLIYGVSFDTCVIFLWNIFFIYFFYFVLLLIKYWRNRK